MASKQAELGLLEPEEQAGKQQHVPRRRLWRTLTLALLIGVVYYKLFWPQELRIIGNGEVHNEGGLDDEFDWYSVGHFLICCVHEAYTKPISSNLPMTSNGLHAMTHINVPVLASHWTT